MIEIHVIPLEDSETGTWSSDLRLQADFVSIKGRDEVGLTLSVTHHGKIIATAGLSYGLFVQLANEVRRNMQELAANADLETQHESDASGEDDALPN